MFFSNFPPFITAKMLLMYSGQIDLSYYQTNEFSHLVDAIGGAMLFVKDTQSTLINGNRLMAEHCGFSSVNQLKKKNDFDIFPHELALHYRRDDREVFSSGKSKLNIVERFPNIVGQLQWIICNKTPIIDRSNKVIGLIGVCQAFQHSQAYAQPLMSIAKSLDFLHKNYTHKINSDTLARLSGLSTRHYERRFRQLFKTSVHQYILDLRILKACELMVTGGLNLGNIAADLGFYDQSAFTASFKRKIGCTPKQYIAKRSIDGEQPAK